MKNLKKLFAEIKNDNRGIALIFTLGILALLLILALAFASDSIIERKAALNTNNRSIARMMAQAAVQRAIGAMRYYISDLGGTGGRFYDIYTHDETSTNKRTYDWLCHMNTTLDGQVLYSGYNPSSYSNTDSEAVHWQYIYDDSSPAEIIGRFAYDVVASVGRLDPSVTVDSGVSYSNNENTGTVLRPGCEVREINIKNLSPSGTNLSVANVSDLSCVAAGGKLDNGKRWVDIEALFSGLGIASAAQKNAFRNWFVVADSPDPEAFWVDTNSDSNKETSELRHRFNLARTDWNDLSGDGTKNAPEDVDVIMGADASGTTPNLFSATFNSKSGIPWLKNYTSLPRGNFPDPDGNAKRAKQIAANLIDYCDSDDIPTSDVAAASWATTAPTYTGNEKTPYINELSARIIGNIRISAIDDKGTVPTADDEYTYIFDIDLEVIGELINIYGGVVGFTNDATLEITGTYDLTPKVNGSSVVASMSVSMPKTFTLTTSNITGMGTSEYKTDWTIAGKETIPQFSYTDLASNGTTASIENVKIEITKAILKYNSINVDCVILNKGYRSAGGLTLLTYSTTGMIPSPTKYYYVSYQVDDPQINLNTDDWPDAGFKEVVGDVGDDPGTPAAINDNTVITPTTSGDQEAGSTPTTISTAYIRNAPMQSPWEIGLIHRGAKWETLNISKYTAPAGSPASSTLGIGTYANGDAQILDQIKMTSDTSTYGKVNLNTKSTDVLRALFADIYIGSGYSAPGAQTGTKIAADGAPNTFATSFAGYVTGAPNGAYKLRSEVIKIANLSGNTPVTRTTDAEREELIGKFINLTTTAPTNQFTVFAIAQSIKDVGAGKISKDLNRDGSIDSSITESGVDINGDGKTDTSGIQEKDITSTLGVYDQYVDQILSEQKIMATLERDNTTGKIKIIRYEYIEE